MSFFPRVTCLSVRFSGPGGRILGAWISGLLLLLQRSPATAFLPCFRQALSANMAEVFRWSVATVAGLGSYHAVAGATTVAQVIPVSGSSNIPVTSGLPLTAVFQVTASTANPGVFVIDGALPAGLVQGNLLNSKIETLAGVTTQVGVFPITITAWEFGVDSGRSASGSFTITVTNPPAPVITQQPVGGLFQTGDLVTLVAGHTDGQFFTWKRDGQALETAEYLLFARSSPRRFLVPSVSLDIGTAWRGGAAFDDSSWTATSGAVGYDTNPSDVNYAAEFAGGTEVRSQMSGTGKPTSLYLRMPFELSAPGKSLSFLKLRHQSDDGFVAFLNGVEIAKKNAPVPLAFNSAATQDSTNTTSFSETRISQHLGLLRKGANLLAVQALNRSNSSNDFLFNCELVGGIDEENSQRLVLTSLSASETGGYTVTASNAAASATSSPPAVLSLPDFFAAWRTTSFTAGEAADPAVSGPAADPDGDGVANLLEFALSRNPKLADSATLLGAVLEKTSGGAGVLVVRVPHTPSLGNVGLRFQTAPSPGSAVWTEVVHGQGGAVVSETGNELELRLPVGPETLFVRLVAAQ